MGKEEGERRTNPARNSLQTSSGKLSRLLHKKAIVKSNELNCIYQGCEGGTPDNQTKSETKRTVRRCSCRVDIRLLLNHSRNHYSLQVKLFELIHCDLIDLQLPLITVLSAQICTFYPFLLFFYILYTIFLATLVYY